MTPGATLGANTRHEDAFVPRPPHHFLTLTGGSTIARAGKKHSMCFVKSILCVVAGLLVCLTSTVAFGQPAGQVTRESVRAELFHLHAAGYAHAFQNAEIASQLSHRRTDRIPNALNRDAISKCDLYM